jgi:hypothetical protein
VTREEAQAVIDGETLKMKDHQDTVTRLLETGECDSAWHEGVVDGMGRVIAALAEALAKSEVQPPEVATRPLRKALTLSPEAARVCGIGYGSGWSDAFYKIPEAGPGLWRGVALWVERGDFVFTVEQVTQEEADVRAQVRAACDAAGWERRAGDE